MQTAVGGLLYETSFQLNTKIKIMAPLNLSNGKLLGIVHFWGKKVFFFLWGSQSARSCDSTYDVQFCTKMRHFCKLQQMFESRYDERCL